MTTHKITPFQLCPGSQAEALAGPPQTTNLTGGHSWKSAHESALLGLAQMGIQLELDFPPAQDGAQEGNDRGHGVVVAVEELEQADQQTDDAAHEQGHGDDEVAHLGRLGFGFGGQEFGRHGIALPDKGSDEPVHDSAGQQLRPLNNRLIGDAHCFGGRGSATEQRQGLVFAHALLKHAFI